MAGGPTKKSYTGWWGNLGSPPQKGVQRYAVSPFAQKPIATIGKKEFFNTISRVKRNTLVIGIPAFIFYTIWTKANAYNEWLYSKEGQRRLHEKLSAEKLASNLKKERI
ncbi:ubiquinol-cytochrome c reductase complex ubiquinone-binding protein QP-C [Nadsonia fulvescens var. elongata DSM 6958]|uniref:Cytochrome b-c1 complex subunit 8 n=1 Tax=Nadsonia fulvescens var. elongata DSM 6958 TaxID=857566 RepID=A0A1E3PSV2_9ASCO|nr:ubiquinol-cytochrome c reductase complex ubiquinone-binding protein QP-C [Nadsonia fulvescens var. elongata DSM 6958]